MPSRNEANLAQVCFISGHKDPRSLQNYDGLTVVDKTKIALAMQHAPTTLDGDEVAADEAVASEVTEEAANNEEAAVEGDAASGDEGDTVVASEGEAGEAAVE